MKKSRTNSYSSLKKEFKPKAAVQRTNASNLEVLYEDNHLIAVNKRSGDLIQGDKTEDKILSEFVAEYISKKYNKPGKAFISIIHRIDRPVTGVVVFARTSKATTRMFKLFKEREVQKTYWAIVENSPRKQEETVINYLKKNPSRNKSYVHHSEAEGTKKSELTYKHVGKGDNYHYLEVSPKTGRHHQIRATLSDIGCPIKGDIKYMAKRTNKDGSVCLHARKIEFIHPVKKKPISIIAPPPKEAIWDEFLKLSGE